MRVPAASLWALAGVVGCAFGVACGSAADSAFGADGSQSGSDAGAPSLGSSGGGNSDATATPPQQGPTATGVVLVHAAAFPPFRLCFSNHLDQQPQPDSKVMPEANVVGVEQGSLVRLDHIDAPGEVFVIDEQVVQSAPGTVGPTCKQLICGIPNADPVGGAKCLKAARDYDSAGTITDSLGEKNVQVMGITGCGNQFFVSDPRVNVAQSDCGTGYDPTKGNLSVKTVTLQTATPATNATIPVELVHMSFLLEGQKMSSALTVQFGTLAGPTTTTVAVDPQLFQNGTNTTLSVDQTNQAVYAQQGFRVLLGPVGGGPATFQKDLSLADVQSLSSPRDVPSDYYTVASNYALLLLGDPRITNDARRGVHLLAVPVLDPSQLDGGTEGGTTGDQ